MDIHKESKEHASIDSFLQWGQWQLLDYIFPTGGFAHSFGFEAAIQAHIVTVRDVISAATRLNMVRPFGSAALQHHIAPISEAILNQWKDRPVEEAAKLFLCLISCRVVLAACFLDYSILEGRTNTLTVESA